MIELPEALVDVTSVLVLALAGEEVEMTAAELEGLEMTLGGLLDTTGGIPWETTELTPFELTPLRVEVRPGAMLGVVAA